MTTTAEISAPTLMANNLRVDRDRCPLCETLTFQVDSHRVVLAGPGAASIAAAINLQAIIAKGQLTIDGHDVKRRQHLGQVGIAPIDPPLPSRMSVDAYLTLAFQTTGLCRKAARTASQSSLVDLGIAELTNRRTESLALPERRAVTLASTLLPGTRTVFAETPLLGLEGPASHYVLAVLGHLSKRRQVIATTSRYDANSPERDLIAGATHVLILDRRDVLFVGTSDALLEIGPRYLVGIQRASDAFFTKLAKRAIEFDTQGHRFVASLPADATTSDLFSIAEASGTTIVELLPIVSGHHATQTQAPTAYAPQSEGMAPNSQGLDTPSEEPTP
ncbi:MAG: hypothetical protein CSA75_00755 [Sorangium cellulosum]|nr:MAG: hypothetical protein CSA75_00755 [Sorangium cellulosum]